MLLYFCQNVIFQCDFFFTFWTLVGTKIFKMKMFLLVDIHAKEKMYMRKVFQRDHGYQLIIAGRKLQSRIATYWTTINVIHSLNGERNKSHLDTTVQQNRSCHLVTPVHRAWWEHNINSTPQCQEVLPQCGRLHNDDVQTWWTFQSCTCHSSLDDRITEELRNNLGLIPKSSMFPI